MFLDPILHGRYPEDVVVDRRSVFEWQFVKDDDLAVIRSPPDCVGLNYYLPTTVRHWTRERPREQADGHGDGAATPWIAADDVGFPSRHGPLTDMGWDIDPRA